MDKKYLMNGLAALAIVAGISSCVKDVDGVNTADQEKAAKENAELQLGLTIPEGQTWEMSQQIAANVTVDLNADETYTVGICDKNPLNFADAKYYALKKVEGGKISATFTAPIAKSDYYVIAYNSKYQAIVNKVEASNGVINANVSYTSGASGTMRSARRAIQSTFNFPSAPDNQKFATTSVPSEAVLLKSYGEGEYFYINSSCEGVNQIQTEHKNRDSSIPVYLYVDGVVDLTGVNNFYLCSGTKIILLPGSKLTLKDNYHFGQADVEVIIPETAELVNNGYIQTESNVKVWNRGTITASYLNVTNGSLVYNEGTINLNGNDSNGLLCVTNNNSVIVNDGTIECKTVEVRGSGHIQNNNSLTVEGPTNINSNDATWVNNGVYTTEYFIYTAGSTDVINNCRLIVNEDFDINLGDTPSNGFRMDANASVKTKNFNGGGNFTYTYYRADWYQYVEASHSGGPFYIYMGASSMFEVTETATMNATKADYGIYGPEEGAYAVFKAKKIVAGKANQGFEVTYGNNLAVVCETHFAQGNDGQADHPYIDFKGNATIYEGGSFKDGKSGSVAPDMETIKASLCSGEFDPGEGDGDDFLPEPAPVTFAFEDQINNGDYDLNDVVLKVTPHIVRNGSGKKIKEIDYDNLDIKLVAAGATFDITVMVDETALSFNGKTEVHDAFGVNKGVMVNTGGTAKSGVQQNAAPVTCTIATPAAVKGTDADGNPTLDLSQLDIWIDVNPGKKSAAQIKYLTEKTEPYAVMIPMDWAWPKERVCIKDAYLGSEKAEDVAIDESGNTFKKNSFAVWAATLDRDAVMNGWYNFPVEGSTMKNK